MTRPATFSASAIARLTGLGRRTIHSEIASGRLRATRSITRRQYVVRRDDLVRWLVDARMPPDMLRSILNPDGAVVLVRCGPGLELALAKTRVEPAASLFHLGHLIATVPCWGVVVDLPACGTAESASSLGELVGRIDRPVLVGLYGDDGYGGNPDVARTFDCLLPQSANPADLARSILRLRPSARSRDL